MSIKKTTDMKKKLQSLYVYCDNPNCRGIITERSKKCQWCDTIQPGKENKWKRKLKKKRLKL